MLWPWRSSSVTKHYDDDAVKYIQMVHMWATSKDFEHYCSLIHKHYHSMCITVSHKLHTNTQHTWIAFHLAPTTQWNHSTPGISRSAHQPYHYQGYHFLPHWGFIIVHWEVTPHTHRHLDCQTGTRVWNRDLLQRHPPEPNSVIGLCEWLNCCRIMPLLPSSLMQLLHMPPIVYVA